MTGPTRRCVAVIAATGRDMYARLGRGKAVREDDRGVITVLVLGLIIVLVGVFGLAFDAAGALGDRQRAADIAAQAARAGADVLVPGTGATVTPRIDTVGADAAAHGYLASLGVHGDVQATATQVTVTVTLNHPTKLLTVIGVTNFALHGTATARPLPGLVTQDGPP
jgi:Flp pilus assembly protein TadG